MNIDNEIRRELQSKFSDYKAPVPPDGWDRIERSLKAARTARMVARRRWFAVSAAAAVILLVGGLLFLWPTAEETMSLVSETASSADRTESQRNRLQAHRVEDAGDATPTAPATSSLQASRLVTSAKSKRIEKILQNRRLMQVKAERSISANDFSSIVKQVPQQSTLSATEGVAEETFLSVGSESTGLTKRDEQVRRNEGQIVLALNSRGGLTPFEQTVNSPMTLRAAQADENNPPMTDPKLVLSNNMTAGNIAEMEHDQPVSFGITVSKSLFENLSVETGLLYTYLSSKTRNSSSNFQVQETQHLHYVGVPLNVNYNLFTLWKLGVYASVGGMLEKDVYGEYRRKGEGRSLELNITSEEEEITKISQRNPQISVNAGLGISYPVYQNLKLYGKIGGAYYFDANNIYKTIYSDSKIVMDLSVGLRYEFK